MFTSCNLLLLSHILIRLLAFPYENVYVGASSLPTDELQALHDVAAVLKKTDWNFNVDPCSGWTDPALPNENNVTCDCNIPNVDGCHVVAIVLKFQNLTGTLPANLSGLPYLRNLDLTLNYLYGSIPSQWGSSKLVHISLYGNRISGSIPKEIGNISTLVELVLEYNALSGVLPEELGNLSSLQMLLLTSNYFSGELPETLSKLNELIYLRMGDNLFTGRIPSFFQKMTNLQNLIIVGNNFSGPIPAGIGSMVKMHDLRISDLVGGVESEFPPLNNLTNLHTLILRNCNLIGSLPNYWNNLANLNLEIDLSFNKLTGEFPSSFIQKTSSRYMYLTNNMLSGTIPSFTYENGNYLDLSYNNFSATTGSCQSGTINLFASSSMYNVSNVVSCLQGYKCHPKKFFSMNINCGGPAINIGNVAYEEDLDPGGPSNFYQSKSNWAFSNTGNFIDTNNLKDIYLQTNTTPLSPNASSLYQTARISPLSLTYYAYCIMNGNYTVQLHFAEIKFTGDRSYMSLGRRFFHVFIQGNRVLENFNIENEAGGVGIPLVKNFTASVVSNTLEIRFYWAGKGTNGIPSIGVWGPIISAITVSPNFPIPSDDGISKAALIGIVIGGLVFISFLFLLVWWAWIKRKSKMEKDIEKLKMHSGWFTLSQIKEATMDFDYTNKLGEGGFGSVYKGLLPDGTVIAVKQLSSVSKQGNREFINEIGMISALQHPNLVKLHGCCIEGAQLFLVYEYMQNNSLARALYGREEHQLDIDWPTRLRICIGIARGLAYLHEDSMVKVVHRDIKTANVLLDKDLNPKISDFGLAKLNEDDNTSIHTKNIAGTSGYMAPEYAMHGRYSSKSDVYSFGVVLLEIVSGKSNTFLRTHNEDSLFLLDWALLLNMRGKLLELIDQKLGLEYNPDEVISVINVAFLCTNVSPAVRPPMSSVVKMLQGTADVQPRRPVVPAPHPSTDEPKTENNVSKIPTKNIIKDNDQDISEVDSFQSTAFFNSDKSGSFNIFSDSSAKLN